MLYIRFIKRLLLILIVCLFALNIQAMRFRHLSMPDGLSQLSVLSIYQDRLGRMWFGTEEGVNIFDGNTVTAIKKFRGMNPHNIEVRRICGDDNGNVYFLLGRSVVAIDYLTQGSKVIVPDGVSALACHAGHLYYARKGHLCSYRIADKTTKVIASTVGTRPNAIYIDRRGYLWAADGSGLYKISVQSRRVLRFYEAGKAGLGEVGFTDIREDCNGRIYVASVGGGIYRLDEKKHAFQVFDTDNSDIMSNFCYAFANVGKQLIYSTEHGIGVLNTTDDSFRNVEFSHDFPIIGINRGCGLFAVGNTILVGGTNGMVAMDVSRLLDTRTHQVYHLHVLVYVATHRVLVRQAPDAKGGVQSRVQCLQVRQSADGHYRSAARSGRPSCLIGLYLLPPAIDWIYLFISFSSFSVTEPKTSFRLYRLLFAHNHSVCLNHPNNI